jgi:hypothetical protein
MNTAEINGPEYQCKPCHVQMKAAFCEKTWQFPELAETFRPMSRELCQRLFVLLAIVLTTTIAFAETNAVNSAALVSTNISITPTNLAQLLSLPPEQLEKVDLARIDLLLAEGLPSSENLDVEQCLKTLDEWASEVKEETERNYHRFVEHPEKFKNSLGNYRMAVMAAVLCQDLRVHYDPQREKELFENNYFTQSQSYSKAEQHFFSDASDFFLQGLVSDKRYGTCASMPYLYVAIGRRLGYPVSIAGAYTHNYVYYDEGNGKHFNVEATEDRGFVTPSDDEYRNPPWGAPSDPNYYQTHDLLQPLSNKESMANLLGSRAAIFRAAGQHDEEAKTWEIAARYFPDTPAWKGIEENMQQAANSDDYQQWRDDVWKELASRVIPRGPGFAYFMDMKIKLYLFMDESLDRQAVQKAADEYTKELDDYSKTVMPPLIVNGDTMPEQPAPETRTLYFYYRPPDGNEVKVPADFLPPFAGGELPTDLKLRIVNTKPQDADALLEIVWDYYAQMQMIKQEKEKAELARIESGNPVLISEESIPPEFRQGVPMDLAIRLSGLHKAEDIVAEMWAYKSEQQNRQSEMMLPDPMAEMRATLKQAGVPDSAMPQMPGMNPVANVPGMPQGMIPNPLGMNQQPQSGNEQVMAIAEQFMKPQQNNMKPGFALPYQVVPASVAANNPAVENPMPFGENSSLTPLPKTPITAP